MDLFDFSDYRLAVEALIEKSPTKVKRGQLAKVAGCSSSWITRIFNGSVQMTTEQLLAIAQFFHLSELETDYLLALLDLERASTILLKERIKTKIANYKSAAKESHLNLNTDESISEGKAIQYYSSWVYGAVHVATMMEKISAQKIADKLSMELESILTVLTELEKMELVQSQSGLWQATTKSLHLSAKMPWANLAHINWRHHVVGHLQSPSSEGLHYSGPHYLSIKDMSVITETLKSTLVNCRQIINDSPGEVMAVLCLDWYRMDR